MPRACQLNRRCRAQALPGNAQPQLCHVRPVLCRAGAVRCMAAGPGLGSAAVAGEEAAQGKGLNKALQPQHHQGVFNAE